jgi:hypothetical protein
MVVLYRYHAATVLFNVYATFFTMVLLYIINLQWLYRYHAATVLFNVYALFNPALSKFTNIRMLRIFHLASMFKRFVAFKIIMKALHKGEMNLTSDYMMYIYRHIM